MPLDLYTTLFERKPDFGSFEWFTNRSIKASKQLSAPTEKQEQIITLPLVYPD